MQAHLHPGRRWAYAHLVDYHSRIAGTQRAIFDADGDLLAGQSFRKENFRGGIAHLLPRQRSHLPRHSQHREASRHAREHIYLQDEISEVFCQRHADRGIGIEYEDAFVFVGDTQLSSGTYHPFTEHTANLGGFEWP
ncbi:hypothetical protein HRbin36_02041 [bacterium HR36]|nr:hypothetical protein HRbin36_02041 [bacterium HR36]